MASEMHQLTPAGHEIEISESDNELKNDLPLEDLEFNRYDEELPNYENIWN
ncbi:11360_t:CDS:2 [Funneliformis caledonium]|uniref:11360_t:CDS:1 n=1 Tax=Funneliformis caledonium TaxID=1117310 RepID=A0A9N9C0C6_9GLOM|nr:11360_t:CDS:2 [Funneliformis caledonium]